MGGDGLDSTAKLAFLSSTCYIGELAMLPIWSISFLIVGMRKFQHWQDCDPKSANLYAALCKQ